MLLGDSFHVLMPLSHHLLHRAWTSPALPPFAASSAARPPDLPPPSPQTPFRPSSLLPEHPTTTLHPKKKVFI
jgi:hypothetical protein